MKTSSDPRIRRHRRVRKKISGTAERPRLAVFRSNRHIYAQLIDDRSERTITAASTLDPSLRAKANDRARAEEVGKLIAQRAREAGISAVVFDRGGFQFHGKVEALAKGARQEGLEF